MGHVHGPVYTQAGAAGGVRCGTARAGGSTDTVIFPWPVPIYINLVDEDDDKDNDDDQ